MALGHLNTHDANILGVRDTSLVKDSMEQVFIYRTQNKMGVLSSLVSRQPRPTGERQSGTVASNSWSSYETPFSLKK